MPDYEELKKELVEISKLLEKFPESVKGDVFNLLVRQYTGIEPKKPAETDECQNRTVILRKKVRKKKTTKKGGAAKTKVSKTGGKESYSIDRNLNLRGDKSIPSFKDFYEEKNPESAKEVNAVAVYYLRKMLSLSEVTLDQAYTCYREVGKKPPQAFRQSFIDTKNKNGWVEFTEADHLDIPHRGAVFVEHDLPKK